MVDFNRRIAGILMLVICTVALLIYSKQQETTISSEIFSPKLTRAKSTKISQKASLNHWTTGRVISRTNGQWDVHNIDCGVKPDFVEARLKYPRGTPIYIYSPKIDVHVSNSIIKNGIYEEQWIQKVLQQLKKYPEAVFIDIGANVGVFSITLAALGYRVISFECLEDNAKRLCASMRASKSPYNMTVVNNALSSQHEKVGIFKYKGDVGGTFIKSDLDNPDMITETVMLDDLLDLYQFKEAIIKMDVEKSEDKVLKGANNFFSKVKIRALLVEFIKHAQLDSGKFIVDFLASHGLAPQVPKHQRNNHKSWTINNILFL